MAITPEAIQEAIASGNVRTLVKMVDRLGREVGALTDGHGGDAWPVPSVEHLTEAEMRDEWDATWTLYASAVGMMVVQNGQLIRMSKRIREMGGYDDGEKIAAVQVEATISKTFYAEVRSYIDHGPGESLTVIGYIDHERAQAEAEVLRREFKGEIDVQVTEPDVRTSLTKLILTRTDGSGDD